MNEFRPILALAAALVLGWTTLPCEVCRVRHLVRPFPDRHVCGRCRRWGW